MFRFVLCFVLVLCCVSAFGGEPTIYGPYYAGSIDSQAWGSTWVNLAAVAGAPDQQSATTSVGFDSVSSSIDATNFGAAIPAGKTVTEIRFQLVYSVPVGLNDSTYNLLPDWLDISLRGDGLFVFDNTESGVLLTPANVNASNFGFIWSIYNMGSPASVSVDAVRMTVICE